MGQEYKHWVVTATKPRPTKNEGWLPVANMSSLTYNAATESGAWRECLAQLPSSLIDLYFQPEYVAMHLFVPEAEALAFSYSRGGNNWFYPFVKQPISSVGSRLFDQEHYCDIEAAYGYAGPISTTDDPQFLHEAHEAFSEWCARNGVVAEFVRLHPLLRNERWLDGQTEVIHDRDTVSIDLATATSDMPLLNSDARYMLRRAERAGVVVASQPPSAGFDQFVYLYKKTMKRVEAGDYYFFGDDYYNKLKNLVEQHGWLLAAEQSGRWVAAGLFLRSGCYLNYHLSASDPDNRVPGATNALIYAAAQIGMRHGLQRFHLGGGRTSRPDDALLKFKQSMGSCRHAFHIAKRVRNQEVYSRVCAIWREQYPSLIPIFGNRFLCYKEKPRVHP